MAAKKNGLLIALILIVLAAAAGAGGWWWMNRGQSAGADANGAADQPLTGTLPANANAAAPAPAPTAATPAEQFTLAAVIDDPNGYTNVRSGPSTVAPTIARVSTGERFTTYEQGGDWWRVRTEGGLIGYMPRLRIRVEGAAPPMTDAASQTADAGNTMQAVQPGVAPARPRQRSRSRINRQNSENMRLFCQNAGRGTPPCRRFRSLGGR